MGAELFHFTSHSGFVTDPLLWNENDAEELG